MQRTVSRDDILSSPAETDPLPNVSSMVSLLNLGDGGDIEDMASASETSHHNPVERKAQQSKVIQEIFLASPKLTLGFSKSQRFICPTCNLASCRASNPPPGYFSAQQISQHNQPGDCWLVAHNVVYDVSRYLVKHPGGVQTILSRAGKDASRDFDFHSPCGKKVWRRLAVGKLIECDQQSKEPCLTM